MHDDPRCSTNVLGAVIMAMLAAFETHSQSDLEEREVIDDMISQLQTFTGILDFKIDMFYLISLTCIDTFEIRCELPS